ncbi:hypothetical protein BOTNAR_0502g00080 [Botryotinia narcissicola]|uniref:Amidase domain-containing protein n=1 Tax=Botryotinia narcissicola TaxID=278944 RepID=A0A4Z1HFL1_9HELO|nr:hypothetical protein BOTNAR_0502g00080 [Botryotinia narcissicola]
MPGQAELRFPSATQILSLLKDNVITVEDYAHFLLHRVDQRDDIGKGMGISRPALLCLKLAFHAQQIPRQARALDRVPPAQQGPLHGLAIAIKDLISTKLNSGPQTANPHDVNRTLGGPSTGSAAVVADFQVPFSIGTQTGGSVIRPASYTGILAMKPTYNAISLEGQKICSISLDTLSLTEVRIAFMQTPMWDQAGPGTITAMNTAFTILHNHDIKIDQVAFPPEYTHSKVLAPNFNSIYETEARSSSRQEYNMDKSKLHSEIRALVETPSYTPKM